MLEKNKELKKDILRHSGDSKYFIDGARDLFCGVALHLVAGKPDISLPEIARHVLTGNAINWITLIRDGNCIEAQEFTNSYYGTSEKNVSGCYGELAKLLSDNGNCISPESLDAGFDLFIEIPQELIQALSPVTSLIVQNFMRAFEARPDKTSGKYLQPVLFLPDAPS